MRPLATFRASASAGLDLEPRTPLFCAAATVFALLLAVPGRIASGGYLNYVSGAWAALGDDFAHGVLYRPLLSELGYGGTRYFPLHIVIHGLLIRLGFAPESAGHVISVGSACILVGGGMLALRRRGATPEFAFAGGLLTLASRTAFMAAAGVRGDLLPLSLGVLALGLLPRDDDEPALASGATLALALLAKPTLAWAPAGALLALVASRHGRVAVKVLAIAAAGVVAGMLAAIWLSHEDMLASFRACAAGGRISLGLLSSLKYVRPGDLTWILGGVGLTLSRGRRGLSEPVGAAGLVCLPVTLLLYTSRGIHINQLVDASALGALAVCFALADPQTPARWARAVLVLGTVAGLAESLALDAMVTSRSELLHAAAALPPGRAPVLSEQPWIPLLAGERPFLLDAFSLEQTRKGSPALDHDLLERLDQCRFRAVVLLGRPESASWWYDDLALGAGFREHLLGAYAFEGLIGAHAFYLPRCGGAAAPPVAGDTATGDSVLDRMHNGSRLSSLRERIRSWFAR